MSFLVKFANFYSWPQAVLIPDATPKNDGVMTAAQAAKLANLIPGGGGYVAIENGGVMLPQETTLNFDGVSLVASDDPGNFRTNVVLANTAVTSGSYGDSTHISTFTVDQQGRLTAAGEVAISPPLLIENGGAVLPQEPFLNFDGVSLVASDDPGVRTNVVLANTAVTPGGYGDATHVASFTVDAQGRLTAAATTAISFPVVTLQGAYTNGAAGQQIIQYSTANQGISFDIDGAVLAGARIAFSVGDSTVNDPTGNPYVYFSIQSGGGSGQYGIKGFNDVGVRHTIPIWGGNATTPCDAMFAMLDATSDALPAGNFALRAQKAYTGGALGTSASAGSMIIVQGRGGRGVGGIDGSIILGAPDNENNLTAPYFVLGPGYDGVNPGGGIGILGKRQAISFETGNVISALLALDLLTLPGSLGSGGMGLEHNGNVVFAVNESQLSYITHTNANTGAIFNTSADFSGGGNAVLSVQNNGVEFAGFYPTATRSGLFIGHSDGTTQGPVVIKGTTGGHGAGVYWSGIGFDATAEAGGQIWATIAGSFTAYGGAASFFEITNVSAVKQALIAYGSGNMRLGPSAAAIVDPGVGIQTDGTVGIGGKIVNYNGETTAGTGVAYIEKEGVDVASAGGGPQTTTVVTFTPTTSGLYRVSITVSCVAGDTVTCELDYTDAVNTTAQAVDPVAAVTIAPNGSYSSTPVLIRANTSSPIAVVITISAQIGTKVSATIERLN